VAGRDVSTERLLGDGDALVLAESLGAPELDDRRRVGLGRDCCHERRRVLGESASDDSGGRDHHVGVVTHPAKASWVGEVSLEGADTRRVQVLDVSSTPGQGVHGVAAAEQVADDSSAQISRGSDDQDHHRRSEAARAMPAGQAGPP
jgi:hypothetical protein